MTRRAAEVPELLGYGPARAFSGNTSEGRVALRSVCPGRGECVERGLSVSGT